MSGALIIYLIMCIVIIFLVCCVLSLSDKLESSNISKDYYKKQSDYWYEKYKENEDILQKINDLMPF